MESLKHLFHPDSTVLQQLGEREIFLGGAVWLLMVWIKMHLLGVNSGGAGRVSRILPWKGSQEGNPSRINAGGAKCCGMGAGNWGLGILRESCRSSVRNQFSLLSSYELWL